MEKLKTLKDFKEPHLFVGLRQEAIRWIKPSDWSDFWEWCKRVKGFDYNNKDIEPIKFIEAWIEYFFNITEEELEDCHDLFAPTTEEELK